MALREDPAIAVGSERPAGVVISEVTPPLSPACPVHYFLHRIEFCHPGYPDGDNLLLRLQAFDAPHLPHGGIQHFTAFLACAIVAGNRWQTAYFTALEPNGVRVDSNNHEQILAGKRYYFHIPATEGIDVAPGAFFRYPVYASFTDWTFPHDNIPPYWEFGNADNPSGAQTNPLENTRPPTASNLSAAVQLRDTNMCIISRIHDFTHCAHLIPRSELQWHISCRMATYNFNQTLAATDFTNDIANAITLREDIHTAFDDGCFFFTRKQGFWVTHFNKPTQELGPLYHNKKIPIHLSVSPAFLLARFALSIFPLLRIFWSQPVEREVLIRVDAEGDVWRTLSSNDVQALPGNFIKKRSGSESPTKRKRNEEGSLTSINELQNDDQDRWTKEQKRQRIESLTSTKSNKSHTPNQQTYQQNSSFSEFDGAISSTTSCSTPFSSSQLSATAIALKADLCHLPVAEKSSVKSGIDFAALYEGYPDPETRRMAILTATERLKQRPDPNLNPELVCCDYNAADKANREGRVGKRSWGGSWLCDRCRGWEIMADSLEESE